VIRSCLIFAVALATTAHPVKAADDAVTTYTATYTVEYKGKQAGVSEWSVRDVGDGRYEFQARITPKGMLKLLRPKPTIERSQFRVEGNHFRPLEYWFEDGSRSGEDNWHVVFDWERRIATVSTSEARRELTVPDSAIDIGTLKAAVMRDLVANGAPGPYQVADQDAVFTYEYTDSGPATLATGVGSLETRLFVQHRAGSSRSTWLWAAPKLGFLPVRIEQRRGDEVQTSFLLQKVDGLAASP
jgi:uncharacterized protein DUF3108